MPEKYGIRMGLRLTSSNDTSSSEPSLSETKAGDPRDESVTQAKDIHDAARATRDDSARPRRLRSQQKLAGTDPASDRILQESAQQARLASMATGAFVAILQGEEIVCRTASGSTAGEFVAYLNRDRRMFDSCLASGDVAVCRDCDSFKDLDAPSCRYLGARCVVLIPLLDQTVNQTAEETEKGFGVFGVFSPQVDAFSSNNIQALQGLSQRIAEELAQAGRFTSASGAAADAVRPIGPKKPLSARGVQPKPAPRRFPAIEAPIAWALGILAAVLLAGWFLSRTMSPPTKDTVATTPAAVSSPVPPISAAPSSPDASAQPASAQPESASASAATVSTKPSKSPAIASVAKPSPKIATGVKAATNGQTSHAANKIAASSGSHIPDLEIENSLDDASFSSSQPTASDTAKALSQPSGAARNRPEPARKTIASNTGPTSPLAGNAPSGLPPREAVRITRAPDSSVGTTPLSPPPNASPDPSAPPPVMLQEWSALTHVTQRVPPDYPPEAKAQHTQGTVVLDVIVGTDGLVESVTPVDGDQPFVGAADKAVRKWHFSPFIRNKQAVRFESHITVNFTQP